MAFPHPQEASRRAEISTRCQDAIPLFSGCPRLQLQKRLRILPLALLVLEFPVLVYNDLTVVADCHAEAFERARRGTFEINTALVIATPVTRAFEFLFRWQPVRRTSQVCADRGENVNLVVFSPDHPDPVLVLVPLIDFTGLVRLRQPRLENRGRFEQDIGEHEPHGRGQPRNTGSCECSPCDGEPVEFSSSNRLPFRLLCCRRTCGCCRPCGRRLRRGTLFFVRCHV